MITVANADLSKMTTVGIGGTAAVLFEPESSEDLPLLPKESDGTYRVISNGSNLLINEREFGAVVSMRRYDAGVTALGGGRYRVGCSLPFNRLIRTANADGYGDIEELCSVPMLVGGGIVMNASVPSAQVCISDHLLEVEVYLEGELLTLPKGECCFGYRSSALQDGRSLVLGATFEFPEQDPEESERRRRARLERVRQTQDRSARNFGSVFAQSNGTIMKLVKKTGLGSGGCHFSKKAGNWLLNDGGTYADAVRAIEWVELLHKLAGKECRREVCIWD